MARMPVAYVPHGGGPLPLLDPEGNHAPMVAFLKQLPQLLPRPRAILLVSAHWEEDQPTLTSSPKPSLLYDYYGFPKEAYDITYPALGDVQLAEDARRLLDAAGFSAAQDSDRGLDHGVFVPLKVSWPAADVPVVELSLLSSLDPTRHLKMGRALQPLREQGVLILGSGMSYHNMGAFKASGFRNAKTCPGPEGWVGADFDSWLTNAVTQHTGAQRDDDLAHWAAAPGARAAHPREEHLLPLMVAAGAAGEDQARHVYDGGFGGFAVSGYVFGA